MDENLAQITQQVICPRRPATQEVIRTLDYGASEFLCSLWFLTWNSPRVPSFSFLLRGQQLTRAD